MHPSTNRPERGLIARTSKWLVALDGFRGSNQMRLDSKAESLRLFHHLDLALFCQSFAWLSTRVERFHQSLCCQRICTLSLVVELGPLLIRALIALDCVQREVLGLFELVLHAHCCHVIGARCQPPPPTSAAALSTVRQHEQRLPRGERPSAALPAAYLQLL
jgi:hypothetical protein